MVGSKIFVLYIGRIGLMLGALYGIKERDKFILIYLIVK